MALQPFKRGRGSDPLTFAGSLSTGWLGGAVRLQLGGFTREDLPASPASTSQKNTPAKGQQTWQLSNNANNKFSLSGVQTSFFFYLIDQRKREKA